MMSEEFVKTVVLDRTPLAGKHGSPDVSNENVDSEAAGAKTGGDKNPADDYPDFDDTSWLT